MSAGWIAVGENVWVRGLAIVLAVPDGCRWGRVVEGGSAYFGSGGGRSFRSEPAKSEANKHKSRGVRVTCTLVIGIKPRQKIARSLLHGAPYYTDFPAWSDRSPKMEFEGAGCRTKKESSLRCSSVLFCGGFKETDLGYQSKETLVRECRSVSV